MLVFVDLLEVQEGRETCGYYKRNVSPTQRGTVSRPVGVTTLVFPLTLD